MAAGPPPRPHPLLFLLLLLPCLCAPTQMSPTAGDSDDGASTLIDLLLRVQTEALRALGPTDFDPKQYVDLPLATDERAAAAALPAAPASRAALESYLAQYFGKAGSDLLEDDDPPDFDPEPTGFLPRVRSPAARGWALEVHKLWKELARRVSPAVAARPERHTLLPLPGRVVVPGSRFREVYYWDSYWVVRGLLVSKMYNTAKDIVLNLLYMVEKYGFVPNGARSYYTNRSQPPLLSSMVLEVYEATGDVEFVRRAFPCLLKEHSFWMSEIHNVAIRDSHGQVHNLSRYQARWNKPRPESATIDEELASKINSIADKEKLYLQIASTAESGWDFSSRWMRNSTDMTTLATTYILPVDLNAFIFKMERDIAVFAKLIGENATSEKFLEASKARHIAIDSVLWNSEMEQWLDYWLSTDGDCQQGVCQWKSESQNRNIFASNFIPLWLNAHHSGVSLTDLCLFLISECAILDGLLTSVLCYLLWLPQTKPGPMQFADAAKTERVMASLQNSGLLCAAGIATSLTNTTQQWDFPNGWAPVQHLIAEGLLHSGSEEAVRLAEDIATRWVRTNYATYKATGAMHEKYDVEACGKFGGGGEYKPQTGFGWSNGVVLSFLEDFGWPEHKEIDCPRRGEVVLAGAQSG